MGVHAIFIIFICCALEIRILFHYHKNPRILVDEISLIHHSYLKILFAFFEWCSIWLAETVVDCTMAFEIQFKANRSFSKVILLSWNKDNYFHAAMLWFSSFHLQVFHMPLLTLLFSFIFQAKFHLEYV